MSINIYCIKGYDEKWYGDEFHYTGMGKVGDQSVTFSQNRTLNESNTNSVAIHLFEVYEKGNYVYQGEVELVNKAYQESQPDDNENHRSVWMFPLKLKKGTPLRFKVELVEDVFTKKTKIAKKISKENVKKIAERKSSKIVTKRDTLSTSFDRDPMIVEYALVRAKGLCQLCDQPAPFNKKNGEPFLEVHHIKHLSNEGSDTIDNVAALCPNCHRKIHILDRPIDIKKLKHLAENILELE